MTFKFALLLICFMWRAEAQLTCDLNEAEEFVLQDLKILCDAKPVNSSVKPCDNFPEFALGSLIANYTGNGTKPYYGLMNEVRQAYKKLQQEALETLQDDDLTIMKVLKNYHSKCIDKDYVVKQGSKEIRRYLQSLGGSKFVNGTSWNPKLFDVTKLFEAHPWHAMSIFLNHRIGRCPHPDKTGLTILCMKFTPLWNETSEEFFKEVTEVLNKLHWDDEDRGENSDQQIALGAQNSVGLMRKFLKDKQPAETKNIEKDNKLYTIRQLTKVFPKLNVNWLAVFNSQLLNESSVLGTRLILIEKFELVEELIELILKSDEATVAGTFVASFLYSYRYLFIADPKPRFDRNKPFIKERKRDEICIDFLDREVGPALTLAVSNNFENNSIEESVKLFMQEVFLEFSKDIVNLTLSDEIKENIKDLLNKTMITVGVSSLMQNNEIELTYKDLELNGNESMVEMHLRLERHHRKILNEKKTSSVLILDKANAEDTVTFNTEHKEFFIPTLWTSYPWFHPQRMRFFNMATFFPMVFDEIRDGIRKYLRVSMNLPQVSLGNDDIYQRSYVAYANWLKTNSEEGITEENLMTKQLFWIAAARSKFNTATSLSKIQNKFMHVIFKFSKGFQEAFNCTMTVREKEEHSEYKTLLIEIAKKKL